MKVKKIEIVFLTISVLAGIAAIYSPSDYYQKKQSARNFYSYSYPPPTASGDLIWAKGMGGTVSEFAFSMTTDPSGNIYTTGLFNGTADFDPGIGTTNLTSNGFNDVFVAKYSNNGELAWAKQIGSSDGDWGGDVALDTNGNVYVTGAFGGVVDFDPGAGEYNITSAGQLDIFIQKLDQNGNFLWAKNMGGTNLDEGYKIKLDNTGNIYLLAQFWETADHDPSLSTFNLSSLGMGDLSITKLDSSGNFIWAKGFGGTSDDYANSFIIGPTGNLYITGNFQNTVDFDPNAGVSNRTSNGFYDMFVSALDKDGQFLWAINIGGSDIDDGMDIELGSNEDIYVSGSFIGTVDFDPGVGTASIMGVGEDDIYVLKLDKNGNYGWVSAVGSSGIDYANDIEIDSGQNIYISGAYSNTIDFDPFTGTTNLASAGGTDIFLSKFNNSRQLLWAKSMGGTLNDSPNGFEIDSTNNLLTTGFFWGTADFDPSVGVTNLISAGGSDIFISKLAGDTLSPMVSTIIRSSTSPTSAASVDFTVTFSEAVQNVDPGDFSLSKTGVITGESITNVTGSGSTRTVTVNTGSGNGTIRLDVLNTASISDLSGNSLNGLPFNTGQTYTITKALPDLIVTNVVLDPPTPSSGETFKVIITIKNQGGPTGLATIYRDVYVGVDPLTLINPATGCPTPGNYFRLDTYINLDSGQSDTKIVSITGGLNNGAHQLWVYVDSRCLVNEVGEVNNGQ